MRRTWATQRGFTLIEMIVVITIVGLVAGIVVTRGPLWSERFALASSARTFASTLWLARARAVASDRIIAVITTGDRYAMDGGPVLRLPAGQLLSAGRVVFTPRGQSSGGTFVLAGRSGRVLISVNWLTGQVRQSAYQAGAS